MDGHTALPALLVNERDPLASAPTKDTRLKGRAGRERCVGAATVDGVACRPSRRPGPNQRATTWTDAQDRGQPLLGDLPSASPRVCLRPLRCCAATHAPCLCREHDEDPVNAISVQRGQATRQALLSSSSYHSTSACGIPHNPPCTHVEIMEKLALPQPTKAGLASMPAQSRIAAGETSQNIDSTPLISHFCRYPSEEAIDRHPSC